MCRRMWRVHTSAPLGWSDIAQHVSIDPRGTLWIGRDWDRAPASARSYNGGTARGPFMIEMIGLFDIGEDVFGGRQKHATSALVAAIQEAFGLGENDITFHNMLTDRKTCPGSAIDHAQFLHEHAQWRRDNPPPQGAVKDANDGPVPPDQLEPCEQHDDAPEAREVLRAARARWRAVSPAGTSGFVGGEELPCCGGADAGGWAMAPDVDARGGIVPEPSISASDFRRVRKHILMLEQGRTRRTPYLDDLPCTVDELRDNITRWRDALPGTARPKILLWAHGGLVPVDGAVRYASEMHGWWKDRHVYPIYFVWDTGFLSVIAQVLRDMLPWPFDGARGGAGGAPLDGQVEAIVRRLGVPFWQMMKTNAEHASDGRFPGGAFELVRMLGELIGGAGEDAPELHAVGHSAGAVFHSHMIDDLRKNALTLESLSLLAPACTVDLFAREVVPHIGAEKTVRRCRVFDLHRSAEIADPTVDFYGKSLLYLISNGFEGTPGVPLLGMEESVRQHPAMRRLFGLDGQEPMAELILAPTESHPDEPECQSTADTHGAFDNDHATLRSILHAIDPDLDPGSVTAPPVEEDGKAGGRSGGGALFPPLERQVADLLPADAPRPARPGKTGKSGETGLSTPSFSHPTGRAYALTIGIDDYERVTPLGGCGNDVRRWEGFFDRKGFDVKRLLDRDTRGRRMHDAMRELVEQARAGDVVAIHYSGHGTQVPDLDGDELVDFKDETLVPVDGATSAEFLLDDDRLDMLDRLARGVHCTLFFDCCHSHTSTRIAAPQRSYTERFVTLPPETIAAYRRKNAARRGRNRSRQHRSAADMNHLLFAACRESQTAKESDGSGWFTGVAVPLLEAGGHDSNEMLTGAIRKRFEDLGYGASDQTPMLDGPDHLRNGPVLGGLLR